MYNFTDLIIKVYLDYTKEKEEKIAQLFYIEFKDDNLKNNSANSFINERNYRKLIKEIETLIRSTVHNYNVDSSYFDAIEETKDFKSWEKNDLKRKQEIYDDLGYNYTFTPTNWEETKNAKELDKALEEGLELVDPVRIITPSKTIQADNLVLRKSKLEYLKSEAIRAGEAKNIADLDTNNNTNSSSINSNNNSDTFLKVSKAFKFTLTENLRLKKKILSQQDYDRLVIWVTEYFEKRFKLPEINEPIEKFYTAKGNIVQAFKDLFAKLEPSLSNSKPDSFFELISLCFDVFNGKTRKQIDGEKRSKDYDEIVK